MTDAGRGTISLCDKTSDELREQCEMCEEAMSNGYCAECEIHFCDVCFKQHLKIRKCRDHVLQDVPGIESEYKTIRFDRCTKHDNQAVKYYCSSHKVFGCADCMLDGHTECRREHITEASKHFHNSGELGCMLKEIEALTETNKRNKETVDSLDDKNVAMDELAVKKIESCAQSAIDVIEAAKLSAIQDTQVIRNENKHIIDEKICTFQKVSSQLDDLNKCLSGNKQPHEIFMLAVESKPTLSSIRGTLDRFESENIIKEYEFENSKALEKVLSSRRPLGKLSNDETDEEPDFELKLKMEVDRNKELTKAFNQQQEEVKKLRAELKSKCVDYETMEPQHKKLQAELKSKSTELETLEKKNKRLDADLKSKTSKLETVERKNEGLAADLKNKTLTLNTLEQNNKRLDADLKSKNSKLETLERNNEKLENEIRTLKNASGEDKEIRLSCGHRGRVDQLSENRTIKCIVCNTVFGDQPPGTMTTATPDRLNVIEITFQFPDGIQSKMNRNPGTRYTGTTKTGYLLDNTDSDDVLAMLKTAFNRKLVFTLNDRGEIVSGVVEVFTEYPYTYQWDGLDELKPSYVEYIKRVKQQLADVGINQ